MFVFIPLRNRLGALHRKDTSQGERQVDFILNRKKDFTVQLYLYHREGKYSQYLTAVFRGVWHLSSIFDLCFHGGTGYIFYWCFGRRG